MALRLAAAHCSRQVLFVRKLEENAAQKFFPKGIAAVVLQFSVFPSWRVRAASATKALIRRLRPSEPGWPKPETWQALKDAVGGNLLAGAAALRWL